MYCEPKPPEVLWIDEKSPQGENERPKPFHGCVCIPARLSNRQEAFPNLLPLDKLMRLAEDQSTGQTARLAIQRSIYINNIEKSIFLALRMF